MHDVINPTVYGFHFLPGWEKLPVVQIYTNVGNVQSLRMHSLEDVRAIEALIRFPPGDERTRKMITMVVLWSLRFGSPLEYLWSTELNTTDPIHFALLEQHVDRLRSRHLGDMRDAHKRFPDNAYVFPAGQRTSVLDTDALNERQKVDVYVNKTSTCIGWSIAGFRH